MSFIVISTGWRCRHGLVYNFDKSAVIFPMKYFFRIVRWPLGQFIMLFDWLTRPSAVSLSPEQRIARDRDTASLVLYQFKTCPFCVRTRRTIHRLGLNIETHDARNDPDRGKELITQGGKYQVPCLRIANEDGTVEWLYESSDINRYLTRRFG